MSLSIHKRVLRKPSLFYAGLRLFLPLVLAKGQNSVLSPDLGVFWTWSQINLKDQPWVQERHFVTELIAIKFFLYEDCFPPF